MLVNKFNPCTAALNYLLALLSLLITFFLPNSLSITSSYSDYSPGPLHHAPTVHTCATGGTSL